MLKKIALIAAMIALPLAAMAQAKFAHMNSQDVITVMPEFTKAQADLDAMAKQYQDEMQRTEEEFNKRMNDYRTTLAQQFTESHRLEDEIMKQLDRIGFNANIEKE